MNRRIRIVGLVLLCSVALGVANVDATEGPEGAVIESENLDGVRGKIFHVDPEARTFELLKETVIDPTTHEGRSRHTVSWTENTVFTQVVRHRSFKDIRGTVLLQFFGLGDHHAAELAAGRFFKSRNVKVLPSTTLPHGISEDGRSVVGLFTPDPEDPRHRKGTLVFGDTTVAASLPGPNGAVDVYSASAAAALNEGLWETRLSGSDIDGRFVASAMDISPLPDPRDVDDPSLPRVLVVGDSISMNYHDPARDALKGVANYYRVEGNAGPSDRGVVAMELWLGDYAQKGLHWDLIQFNHGLHDLKQLYDDETETYGAYQIGLEAFKANLEAEIAIMRKTGATLMWCDTTPVPNSSVGVWGGVKMGRKKDADRVFNGAAREVLKNHPDILINPLSDSVREAAATNAVFASWNTGGDVHFWDGRQAKVVGEAVAVAIKRALAHRAAHAEGTP